MALSDGPISSAQILEAQRRAREHKEALERAAAVEASRASEVREHTDAAGAKWQYVTLDDAEVRLERCLEAQKALHIPEHIEGKPVVALANDCCAYLSEVEEVILPDSIVSVGFCAFRECKHLRSISFPRYLATFDSDWVRRCARLEHLVLPGQLDRIKPAVFDIPHLKHLEIGEETDSVIPGAFAKSRLESIAISPDNPSLCCDGDAIYTADGSILLALARPVDAYGVKEGCEAIAKKGFSAQRELKAVSLPATLEIIGDHAFAKTSIEEFASPPSLKAIGERAFFDCSHLRKVTLNEGLLSIAPHAFTDTAISELRIPSTIQELGNPLADHTALTYAGPEATFSISQDSAALKLDEQGGLYRSTDDGLHLLRMMEPSLETYEVDPACVAIDPAAFAKHPALESVILPEGIISIGEGAFRDCRHLRTVNIPSSLERIGEEAFLGTNLSTLFIPAGLKRIGALALITEGAHHGSGEPSLKEIMVDAGNTRFSMEGGLLLEHMDGGFDRVVLCTGAVSNVVIPETVTAIAPYAFNGVRTIETITLSDRITMVEVRGLAFDSLAENIHIDLVEPIEGHEQFDIRFPHTTRAAQQMMLAFSVPSFVNVEEIFSHYDNSIVNASGFDAETEENLDPYEQITRILERLRDPVYLSPVNRSLSDRVIRSHFKEFCIAIAKHDDRQAIESLLDLGYIDEENIHEAIDHVGLIQDASITNYLLEAQRSRFGRSVIDFETDFEL